MLATLLAGCSPAEDQPQRYLASITGITLGEGEGLDGFEIEAWGVEFKAVCRIPEDWEILAGRFGISGRLTGQAGHGASMIRAGDEDELRSLVLIELHGPVEPVAQPVGSGVIPATFSGQAIVQSPEDERTIALTAANVKLVPASQCPDLAVTD